MVGDIRSFLLKSESDGRPEGVSTGTNRVRSSMFGLLEGLGFDLVRSVGQKESRVQ